MIAVSEDKRIIAWDTKQGVPLTSLQLHQPILDLIMSTDATRVAVLLLESKHLPIVCLHNTPATYVKIPAYVAPKEIEGKNSMFYQGDKYNLIFFYIQFYFIYRSETECTQEANEKTVEERGLTRHLHVAEEVRSSN